MQHLLPTSAYMSVKVPPLSMENLNFECISFLTIELNSLYMRAFEFKTPYGMNDAINVCLSKSCTAVQKTCNNFKKNLVALTRYPMA